MSVGTDLPQQFADAMGTLLGPDFPTVMGVAVSGGGDSMVMLHVAAGWARVYGIRLSVVTVDHGLRAASATEAALVAGQAAELGLPHATLRWAGWDGQGNLQDAARRARRDLIGHWRGAIGHVLMGHTQDDQAETFLLRLARGSGVEGLAGMSGLAHIQNAGSDDVAATVPGDCWHIVRPLLGVSRAALRHYATVLQIPYVDDPSNLDPRFERVKMRAMLDPLASVGLTRERLAGTAVAQQRARAALMARARDVAARLARTVGGDVVFDRDDFARIEIDTQLRLLAAAVQLVSSAPYRPRLLALEAALDRMLSGGVSTLHGAIGLPLGKDLWIAREHAAVASTVADCGSALPWDNRWIVTGPDTAGLQVRALGETGLPLCPNWRATGIPRTSLLSSPAVWQGKTLIAAPLAGFNEAWQARIVADFHSSLLSH